MSINPPLISAGPSVTRAQTKAVAVQLATAVPPGSYFYMDPNGLPTAIEQPADIEGRIAVYRSGTDQFVQMYVVVDTGTGLEWKPVLNTTVENSYTGKAYDPLARYYDPLAS